MKPKRSDQSIAIYGILGVTTVALIGLLVLLGLGREVPEALLTGVVLGGMTGVLGWARGGTYYEPDEERIPAPVVVEPVAPVVEVEEKYPFAVDETELEKRQ